MTKPKVIRRASLTLLAVLAVVLGAVTAGYAGNTKPALVLGLSPASQSIVQGATATYTVTVSATGGFTGAATLAAASLPVGASASFSPASVTLTATTTSVTSQLTVTTTSATPVKSHTFSVVATSGKTSDSLSVGLVVNAPPPSGFALTLAPASVTAYAGDSASFSLSLARTSFTGSVALSLTGAPAGSTVTFSPATIAGPSGTTATLQVTSPAAASTGSYALKVTGTSGALSQTASATLTLDKRENKPFTISGTPSGVFSPGVWRTIDLTLGNANNQDMDVTNLTVTVTGTSKPACAASNFAVQQMAGPYPVALRKNVTAKLSALGVASPNLPRVQLVDKPVNQDSCKGVTVNLAYSGSAQGS